MSSWLFASSASRATTLSLSSSVSLAMSLESRDAIGSAGDWVRLVAPSRGVGVEDRGSASAFSFTLPSARRPSTSVATSDGSTRKVPPLRTFFMSCSLISLESRGRDRPTRLAAAVMLSSSGIHLPSSGGYSIVSCGICRAYSKKNLR